MTKDDTENYIKLHLLEYKVGTSVLRGLFLKIVKNSSRKGNVDQYLLIFKNKLQKLRLKKQISHAAFQVLFPDNDVDDNVIGTDVDEWDLTLLSIVLRFCCYNKDTLREQLVHHVNTDFNLDTLLQNEGKSDSRNHELSDDQNDQLFPKDGPRRDISAMDFKLLVWIVFKFGNEPVWRRFNLSMWKYVRTELQLADSVEDFLNNSLQKKDNIETMLSDKKLPSLHSVLKGARAGRPIDEVLKCSKVVSEIAVNIEASLDNETVKAISTINQMRNELGHNQAAINKREFISKWEHLLNAINTIVQTELPEMKTTVEKKVKDIDTESMSIEIGRLIGPLEKKHDDSGDTATQKIGAGVDNVSLSKTMADFIQHFDINECCKENDRKSPIVKSMCDLISNLLSNCSPKILRVWPAYRSAKEEDFQVVFVAVTEDDQINDIEIPLPLQKFEIKYRTANEYSQEESFVMSSVNRKEKYFTDSELEQLGSLLRKNSKRYMDEHQNLNIMSASQLKSVKYGRVTAEIKHEVCVVFYVETKGLIPLGEDEFPKYLGGFATDVRESSFELYSPKTYHPRLKMGCLIASDFDSEGNGIQGTLGPFVDLPDGNVGCFTSAHAILHGHMMQDLIQDKYKVYNREIDTRVFQPLPTQDARTQHFGHVIKAVYKSGGNGETGIEAALIKITDPTRIPDSAEFPEKHCEDRGLADTSRFKSGFFLTEIPKHSECLTVFKFGAETCLTRGAFKLHGGSVRKNTLDATNSFGICLHNQIEMITVGPHTEVFAEAGDSGAVVLIPHNGDQNDLRAIGIITGGNNQGTIFITPIVDILRAFGYDNISNLKSFQNSKSPGLDEGPMDTEETRAIAPPGTLYKQDVTRNVSLESFDEFKEDVNKKLQKLDDGQSSLEDGQRNLEGGQKETNETLKSMHDILKQLVPKETKGE